MHSAHSVHRFRSLSVPLVLTLLLAAPWPVQAKPFEASRPEAKASPIHLFIDWLAGLWDDNGCTFDPNSLCLDSSEPASGSDNLDNGCTFDPSGSPCRDGR